MATTPQQHYFVSHRDITITSTQGYSIKFEKGKAQHVPKRMHSEVQEKGCLASDQHGKPLSLDDQPEQEQAHVMLEPEDADERGEKISAAMQAIVARNNPHDFSAGGMPSAGSLTAMLGWKVDPREVRKIWAVMKPELLKVT